MGRPNDETPTANSRQNDQDDLVEEGWCRMALARHDGAPPAARITRAKAAEADHTAVQNARAARTVAGHAADAEDCSRLLAMLGLEAAPYRPGGKSVA